MNGVQSSKQTGPFRVIDGRAYERVNVDKLVASPEFTKRMLWIEHKFHPMNKKENRLRILFKIYYHGNN